MKNLHSQAVPSRRSILRAGVASAALTATSWSRVAHANERVGVGFIGYGLIGKPHVEDFKAQSDVHMAAISDAHRGRLEEAREFIGGDIKTYPDFRRLLEDSAVDAVCIATPDHWHALMTMMACDAGKDVYVEKPLTLFVREGRWMNDVARRANRVVQVGTQQRSGLHYQRMREFIQGGGLGDMVNVRINTARNLMPGLGHPADGEPPAELDWEMFTGPSPMQPYNPHRGIYQFRWQWNTSGGQMTNLGAHSLDIAYWYLNPPGVKRVFSVGGRHYLDDNCEVPDHQETILEYPGWTCTISISECSEGSEYPGLEFFGTKGSMQITRRGYTVFPDKKVHPYSLFPLRDDTPTGAPVPGKVEGGEWTEPLRDRSGNDRRQLTLHVRNFLDCVKSRTQPLSDLESAHRMTTDLHLANLSLRLGRLLVWDAEKEDVVGDPEASQMLTRSYRTPWDAELKSLGVT